MDSAIVVVNEIEVVCSVGSASVDDVVFDDGVATHPEISVGVDAAAVGRAAVAGESAAINIDYTTVGDGTAIGVASIAGEGAAIDGQRGISS